MKYKLSDLTIDGKGSYGIAASAVEYDPNKYTYLRITDINDDGTINFDGLKSVDDENAGKYILKENDIVFARTGASTGRTYFYQKKDGVFVFAGFLIKYSLDPNKVNPRFLKYYTHSKTYYDWVRSFDSGATRGNINAKTFGDMLIDLPERFVQDKIVSILSDLDDKIECNRKICANLEAQAQVLFKHWFVDFAPFKDGKFVESELGLIPEGWRVATLNDVCKKITDGSHYSPKDDPNGTIPMLSVKDMQHNGFDYSSCKMINDEEYLKMKNNDCVPLKNDILVAKDGSYLKEIFICQKEVKQAILSSIAIFRCNSDIIYPELLLQMLRLPKVRKDVGDNYVSGTALPRIVLKDFKKYCFVVAPIDVQKRIIGLIRSLYIQINNNEQESHRLSTLRDTLLPKLMSGEIKI